MLYVLLWILTGLILSILSRLILKLKMPLWIYIIHMILGPFAIVLVGQALLLRIDCPKF